MESRMTNDWSRLRNIPSIMTPEPHHTKGYGGFIPRFQYRCGESVAQLSHKIILDPASVKSKKEDLFKNLDYVEAKFKPYEDDIEFLKQRQIYSIPEVFHSVLPTTYEGCVPLSKNGIGDRKAVTNTTYLREFFEKTHKVIDEKRTLCEIDELTRVTYPRYIKDRQLITSDPGLPLAPYTCYGEPPAVIKDSKYKKYSPLFSDPFAYDKVFKSGYTGHIPELSVRFGRTADLLQRLSLAEFGLRRRFKKEETEPTIWKWQTDEDWRETRLKITMPHDGPPKPNPFQYIEEYSSGGRQKPPAMTIEAFLNIRYQARSYCRKTTASIYKVGIKVFKKYDGSGYKCVSDYGELRSVKER